MKKVTKITINTLAVLGLCLAPFAARAMESVATFGGDQYESIYRYNALENTVSFSVAFLDPQADPREAKEEPTPVVPAEPDHAYDVGRAFEDMIERQDFSLEKIESAMNALRYQNLVKTILVGRKLGILRFELAQIKDQIYLLDRLALKDEKGEFETEIGDRKKFLEEQREKVENFIVAQEDAFSLFGWFARAL